MAVPLIRSGYDVAVALRVRVDGANEDLSAATIKASLVNAAKTSELIADTAQSAAAAGAAWGSGLVVVEFSAAQTTGLSPADVAYIELAITLSGKRLPVEHVPVKVETGWTVT